MPLSDSFLVTSPEDKETTVVFGINCIRPRGEAQEVVCYERRSAEPNGVLQCTKAHISDSGTAFAVVATKPVWMWGVEAGANECGVTIFCVATFTQPPDDSAEPDGALLAEDFVRLGLERGRTASDAVDVICKLATAHGLGSAGGENNCCDEKARYACLVSADKHETWILDMKRKLCAARRLAGGYCCIPHTLLAGATYDGATYDHQSDSDSQMLTAAAAARTGAAADGGKYCLKQNEPPKDTSPASSMFYHLREASLQSRPHERLEVVASMVSVMHKSSCAAGVHWFTATPDPNLSIFKPFVFSTNTKRCSLTVSPQAFGETSAREAYSHLYREHETCVGRLRANDGRLRDILRQLEAECEQEMADHARGTDAGDNDAMSSIFADVCDAEIKFYRKTSL